jgi:hypothetical protein
MNTIFLFEKNFDDGGQRMRLHVELVTVNPLLFYYHCQISPVEFTMTVNQAGELVKEYIYIDEFDLYINEQGQWVELEHGGGGDFSETIGGIIEREIL